MRAVLAVVLLASCVYGPIDVDGLRPPCVEGYSEIDGGPAGARCVRAHDGGVDAHADGPDTGPRPCEPGAEMRCAGGRILTCVDGIEVPETFVCDGDDLLACDDDALVRAPCPGTGCITAPEPHCDWVPTNIGTEANEPTAAFVVPRGARWSIDTDSSTPLTTEEGSGQFPEGVERRIHAPSAGVHVFVVRATSLRIEAGATLRAEGSSPLAFLVEGDVVIEGTFDSSGGLSTEIPAGMDSSSDLLSVGRDGSGDASFRSGGGGGGYGGAGGAGGLNLACGDACPARAEGGEARGSRVIDVLFAGSSGGSSAYGLTSGCALASCGGDDELEPLRGGQGGGAIQIVSRARIVLASSGAILAQGEGGRNGAFTASGSGGGSGGAIVLEAPIVEVLGAVRALGGAGGTGAQCDDCCDDSVLAPMCSGAAVTGSGESGRADGSPARPQPARIGAASGGTGGIADAAAEAGSDGDPAAGGGGGGAGRIRFSSSRCEPAPTTVTPSPARLRLGTLDDCP